MKTKLLHFTTLFKVKKKKKKRQNTITYQPHSATLTYSDKLLKITPTKLVNTQYHPISHIPVQKDILVKTCCKIIYRVLNKRFKTKEILPCMAINTNFGEIRCSPAPLPEKIDGNVNCTRVYRHTCTWWSIQSDRGCDMGRSFLRHLWSRIPW